MRHEQDFQNSEPVSVPPPIPAFSWLGSLSPLLIGPIFIVALVALFAPDNVLDQWSSAKAFTSWMLRKLPFMNRHADSTVYPQVALFVHCLTVALIPVLSLVWLVASFVNYPKLLARNRATKQLDVQRHLVGIFFGIPLFFVFIYVMVALPGDPSWAKGFTTHRRGGLASLNCIMLYLASLVLGAFPISIRLFFDLHLKKEV